MNRQIALVGIVVCTLTLVVTGPLLLFRSGENNDSPTVAPEFRSPDRPTDQAVVPRGVGGRIVPLDSYSSASTTDQVRETVASAVRGNRIMPLDSHKQARSGSFTIAEHPSVTAGPKR